MRFSLAAQQVPGQGIHLAGQPGARQGLVQLLRALYQTTQGLCEVFWRTSQQDLLGEGEEVDDQRLQPRL